MFSAVINGIFHCYDTVFNDIADFERLNFQGLANFNRAIFKDDVDFSYCTFHEKADFSHASSKFVPNFKLADFKSSLSMFDFTINEPTEEHIAPISQENKDISSVTNLEERCRILKKLADDAKDNERKQMFFAYEMMAKRKHLSWGFELGFNYIYDWVSDFGQSFTRPFLCLILLWLGFALLYTSIAMNNYDISFLESFPIAMQLSANNIAPFITGNIPRESIEKLFEPNTTWLFWVSSLKTLLGLLFAFLIGLGLRNRFLSR